MESIWDQVLNDKKEANESSNIDFIPNISLTDFRKRNMGVLVYSKYLDDEVWFCSNQKIANKIISDDPDSTTYTVDELINILSNKTDMNSLKLIHEAKKCFKNSQVIKAKTDSGSVLIEKKPNSE